jgi:hypothetical protein
LDDKKKRRNYFKAMIKTLRLLACGLSFFLMDGKPAASFPEAKISNGILSVKFFLPDTANGYYRGTRFDWSGVTPEIEYKGHSFCGQWFENYSPTLHDAVMGPVEVFYPLNYEQAASGGHFITIGVGSLLKDSTVYSPYRYHKILNAGLWRVKIKTDKIEFTHTLNDPEYAYEYKKEVLLTKGKPEMILVHRLKNNGSRIIETDVYDHNFFLIDQQETGPQQSIIFPFTLVEIKGGQGLGEMSSIRGNQIVINRPFLKTEQAYTVLEGYGQTAKDYNIRIENHNTGAGVLITADKPMSKLVFWARNTILCPEPYIHLKINPGETISWKISYLFSSNDVQH